SAPNKAAQSAHALASRCARNRAYRLPVFGACRSGPITVFRCSRYQMIPAPEFTLTPPSARTARLDRGPLSNKRPATRNAPARADHPFRGIALILASTVFLGISDVTAKYLSVTLPSIEIAWIRFLVFALIMSPAMVPGSALFALQSRRPGLQVMRG